MDKLQSSAMPSESETDSNELQRLAFVKTYSEAAFNKSYEIAGSVYSTTRGYVPTAIEDTVAQVEGKVSEISSQYGAPIYNTVQDKSQQVLGLVDSQVDSVVTTFEKNTGFLKGQSDFHTKNFAHFKEARDNYVQQAKDAIAFLREHGVSGTAKHAADQVSSALDSAKQNLPSYLNDQASSLMEKVTQTWDKLAGLPAVQKTLEAVSPSVELAKKKYLTAHDALMKTPAYDSVFQTGQSAITKAKDSYPYKTAANKLYPLVSPIADPVIDKASPFVNGVIEHLTPQHTATATA